MSYRPSNHRYSIQKILNDCQTHEMMTKKIQRQELKNGEQKSIQEKMEKSIRKLSNIVYFESDTAGLNDQLSFEIKKQKPNARLDKQELSAVFRNQSLRDLQSLRNIQLLAQKIKKQNEIKTLRNSLKISKEKKELHIPIILHRIKSKNQPKNASKSFLEVDKKKEKLRTQADENKGYETILIERDKVEELKKMLILNKLMGENYKRQIKHIGMRRRLFKSERKE